jgi:hypothetical protein
MAIYNAWSFTNCLTNILVLYKKKSKIVRVPVLEIFVDQILFQERF